MLEQILYEYLNSNLSVPAYLERPKDPPEKFVVIERVGGGEEEKIRHGTFALQSVAKRLYEAAALNEEVLEVMEGAVELKEIGSVHLNSFYNFTNQYQADREEHRYQAIFEIIYY